MPDRWAGVEGGDPVFRIVASIEGGFDDPDVICAFDPTEAELATAGDRVNQTGPLAAVLRLQPVGS